MEHTYHISFARTLRKNQTDAEKLLWSKLRDRRLAGVKFRRQQRVGSFIVDFVCLEKKIIIEVDGSQHNTEFGKKNDAKRLAWLRNEGFTILQFWNNEVFKQLEDTLEKINLALTPALSQGGRGLKGGANS